MARRLIPSGSTTHHVFDDYSSDAREHGLGQRRRQHVGNWIRPWRWRLRLRLAETPTTEDIPELTRLLV
jgi:hypothetical protein